MNTAKKVVWSRLARTVCFIVLLLRKCSPRFVFARKAGRCVILDVRGSPDTRFTDTVDFVSLNESWGTVISSLGS